MAPTTVGTVVTSCQWRDEKKLLEMAEIEVAVVVVSAGMVICDRRPLEEQGIV